MRPAGQRVVKQNNEGVVPVQVGLNRSVYFMQHQDHPVKRKPKTVGRN